MANTISFNPFGTTSPQNTFLLETNGYMAGLCLADPSSRMWLRSGVVSASNTQPLWGALPVELIVPTLGSQNGLEVLLAGTNANLTGFAVFDQGYNGVISTGSNAPQYNAGMSVPFYDLGSRIRVPVPVSSALAAAAEGGAINQQVSWNFTTNELDVYNSTTGALNVKVLGIFSNSLTLTYDSATGSLNWTAGDVAVIQL
jgi:hypothetical protein